MAENRLLKPQKNDVLKSIQEVGLHPLAFTWEGSRSNHIPSLLVSTLRFRSPGSTFYFKFDHDYSEDIVLSGPRPTIRRSKFSPGSEQMTEELQSSSWAEQRTHLVKWLTNLKREVQTPDLWEQLKQYSLQDAVVDTTRGSNAPLSSIEKDRVVRALDEFQAKITQSLDLNTNQIAFVTKQMQYLKEGAKKHGRIDWINISIGVMANIAVMLALEPEKAKLLWDLVRSCFAGILSLPPP